MIIMIIVWSVVIAGALLIEFTTNDMVSCWFATGGVVCIILAACSVPFWWQILTFFVVSFVFLLSLRRFTLRFVRAKTVPTNLDANIGTTHKLRKDVKDGISEIKINDIIWTVSCSAELKEGDAVEITEIQGNKYIVKKAGAEAAEPVKTEKSEEKKK